VTQFPAPMLDWLREQGEDKLAAALNVGQLVEAPYHQVRADVAQFAVTDDRHALPRVCEQVLHLHTPINSPTYDVIWGLLSYVPGHYPHE
jgi:hypothetical protein